MDIYVFVYVYVYPHTYTCIHNYICVYFAFTYIMYFHIKGHRLTDAEVHFFALIYTYAYIYIYMCDTCSSQISPVKTQTFWGRSALFRELQRLHMRDTHTQLHVCICIRITGFTCKGTDSLRLKCTFSSASALSHNSARTVLRHSCSPWFHHYWYIFHR